MNISELFEEIQNNFESEDLNGEFQLHGNCIMWTYNLEDESEEITSLNSNDEDELNFISFDSTSPEELLQDVYNEDYELLIEFIESIEETDNWTISDPDIGEYTISFKIF